MVQVFQPQVVMGIRNKQMGAGDVFLDKRLFRLPLNVHSQVWYEKILASHKCGSFLLK